MDERSLAPALTARSRRRSSPELDLRVLGFAIAAAAASAILFGLAPAFRATDLHVGPGLQAAGRGATHEPRRRLLSGALVVLQIGLSLLLIAGAGLMVRTVSEPAAGRSWVRSANLLLFRIDPALNGYEPGRTRDLYTHCWIGCGPHRA